MHSDLYVANWTTSKSGKKFSFFRTFNLFSVTVLMDALSFVVDKLYSFVNSTIL